MQLLDPLYRDLLNQLTDGVYLVDPQRRIMFWNRGAELISGYSAQEVIGRPCSDNVLMHVDHAGNCLCTEQCPLADSIERDCCRSAHVFLHHKLGHRVPVSVRTLPLHDRFGNVIGGIEAFTDASTRSADLERIHHLEQIAFLDELTGIANRRYLQTNLDVRLAEAARHDWQFGAIFVDIDHFKKFNDTFGHDAGDRVLRTLAATLSKCCRSFDLAGRWGGEEFMIVAAHLEDGAQLGAIAERARALIAQSTVHVTCGEVTQDVRMTVSIGAALVRPEDDAESLVRRADSLMYASKSAGRNRVTCDFETVVASAGDQCPVTPSVPALFSARQTPLLLSPIP